MSTPCGAPHSPSLRALGATEPLGLRCGHRSDSGRRPEEIHQFVVQAADAMKLAWPPTPESFQARYLVRSMEQGPEGPSSLRRLKARGSETRGWDETCDLW